MDLDRAASLEPAYVLHRRPYRDTSLIVDLLTCSQGRIPLVARGARRPGTKLHGINQPFRPLGVRWRGRGEMATLTDAEVMAPAAHLQGRALFSALYVNEILVRLLHRQAPCPDIYPVYVKVLDGLSVVGIGDAGIQKHLRVFEVELLNVLGYGLMLDHEADTGRPVDAARSYFYRPQFGPVSGIPGHPRTGLVPGIEISGEALLALHGSCGFSPGGLKEAKCLMRYILSIYLGRRPLNSRRMFAVSRRCASADTVGRA